MARCPFAEWVPGGTTPGGAITPRVIILHVTAGEGDARPHSGLEWHFEVFYDGRIQQQVDTSLRADANHKANPFAISIETEGLGEGWWTAEQINALLRLIRWLHEVHPTIPLVVCDDPYGSGVGFHTLFGSPSAWTPVAKSCPGPNRKTQFWDVIVPALSAGQEEAADMTPEQSAALNDVEAKVRDLWYWLQQLTEEEWIQNHPTFTGAIHKIVREEVANVNAAGGGSGGGLTIEQVTAACEAAVRSALGQLDEA